MDMIVAQHLTKSFGHHLQPLRAVDNLNLHVAAGEIFGLVGPDGAGKTTAIRLLCGALRPDPLPKHSDSPAPLIRIGEYDVLTQTDAARSLIGYLPQRFSLYEDMTVLENLRFFSEVRGLPAAEWQPRCMEILRFVGLDGFLDRRAGHLSGGMKQKLGLAAALAHRPRVLLLDEPTTGVDPVTRQDFWQLIIRLVTDGHLNHGEAGGVAVLVSTPYMDEAARCTRLGFIRNGRLLVEGAPGQLRARLDGRILELRGRPLNLLRRVTQADEGVEDVQMFGDRIHLRTRPEAATAVEARLRQSVAAAGGELTLMRPVPPQLEDVFISLS